VNSRGEGNHNVFFSRQQKFALTFVVSGMSEDPSQNASLLRKVFQALQIECRNYPFSRIVYETLYQRGEYQFSVDSPEFWMNAEYLEHKWAVPIAVQTSEKEDDFAMDSEMRGTWMKVTLEYTGNKDLEIRSVETEFNISTA
jgi:hypothetical protein